MTIFHEIQTNYKENEICIDREWWTCNIYVNGEFLKEESEIEPKYYYPSKLILLEQSGLFTNNCNIFEQSRLFGAK